MIKKTSQWIARALVFTTLLVSPVTFADESEQPEDSEQEVEFEVSPKTCVTLRQGQPCFVRVRFNWRSNKAMAACLYNLEGTKITCWKSSEKGSVVLSQSLPNTTEYILVNDDGEELTRASVAVSWVYRKKRSRRRWRLF